MIIRPLRVDDFERGYLVLLGHLTEVGEVAKEDFSERLLEIDGLHPYLQVWVVEVEDKVVGTATLFVEPKFIHGCSRVGHIEDVAVDPGHQGRGLGKALINHLVRLSKEVGCYKVILDCSKKNKAFYEQCGFQVKNVQMSLYFS